MEQLMLMQRQAFLLALMMPCNAMISSSTVPSWDVHWRVWSTMTSSLVPGTILWRSRSKPLMIVFFLQGMVWVPMTSTSLCALRFCRKCSAQRLRNSSRRTDWWLRLKLLMNDAESSESKYWSVLLVSFEIYFNNLLIVTYYKTYKKYSCLY